MPVFRKDKSMKQVCLLVRDADTGEAEQTELILECEANEVETVILLMKRGTLTEILRNGEATKAGLSD